MTAPRCGRRVFGSGLLPVAPPSALLPRDLDRLAPISERLAPFGLPWPRLDKVALAAIAGRCSISTNGRTVSHPTQDLLGRVQSKNLRRIGMIDSTFLRLQHSESVVCEMASTLLAAYIASGQLTSDNEDELIDRTLTIAIKLARRADRVIESDNENSDG